LRWTPRGKTLFSLFDSGLAYFALEATLKLKLKE
jgi:hypothetical protein